LNDDTEVTCGWAEPAVAAFSDPLVAAVAPLVLCHPGKRASDQRVPKPALVDSAGDGYYLGGVAVKRRHRSPLRELSPQAGLIFGASASASFFRRDAVMGVGSFPESFGAYFEDLDLSFRLHWAGYRVQFEPRSQVWHHISSSHKQSRRLAEQQSRNE